MGFCGVDDAVFAVDAEIQASDTKSCVNRKPTLSHEACCYCTLPFDARVIH